MIDPQTTTLASLLQPYCQAEVARRVGLGEKRAAIHRLYHGQPLYDDSLIAPLARVLRLEFPVLEKIVKNDRARARQARARRDSTETAA